MFYLAYNAREMLFRIHPATEILFKQSSSNKKSLRVTRGQQTSKVNQHPRVGKQDTVVRTLYVRVGVSICSTESNSTLFVSRRALFAARKNHVRRPSRGRRDATVRGNGKVDARYNDLLMPASCFSNGKKGQ